MQHKGLSGGLFRDDGSGGQGANSAFLHLRVMTSASDTRRASRAIHLGPHEGKIMWQEPALGFSHLPQACATAAPIAGLWNFQQGGGGLFLEIRVLILAYSKFLGIFPSCSVGKA